MFPLRKTAFLLLALAALPCSAETWYKDRVRFEDFPREVEEGKSVTFSVIPQGKWRYGWCAVTFPDGTTEDFKDAEIKNGKAAQKLVFNRGKGKYVVEFLVEGDLGPAVGAIFNIYAGVPAEAEPERDYTWDKRPAAEIEKDVFDRINAFRAERKLAKVEWDEKVADLGRDHCQDMIDNRFFAHISPKAGDMANRAKVKYGWKNATWGLPDRLYLPRPDGPIFIGEDLAFDNSAAGAMDAWLGSPGHRAVFMNKYVTHLGVGVRKYEAVENGILNRRIYLVAAFALYADANLQKAEEEAASRAEEAKAWVLLEKAREVETRDAPAAVKLYDELAAKYPDTPSGQKAAARSKELTTRPDWADVVKTAEGRREARGWLDRAKMLIQNKRPDNAREWLRKVSEKYPSSPEADEAARLLKDLGE